MPQSVAGISWARHNIRWWQRFTISRCYASGSPKQPGHSRPDLGGVSACSQAGSAGQFHPRRGQAAALGDRALFEEKITKLTKQLDAESAIRLFAEGALRSAR
jgi:hypothetical protein